MVSASSIARRCPWEACFAWATTCSAANAAAAMTWSGWPNSTAISNEPRSTSTRCCQRLDAGPLLTDWLYLPSARLGGDAFGYEAIDEHTYLIYLIDVSGHGVGAAMHSLSVLNAIKQRAVSAMDLTAPARVLSRLNVMFPMERHDDQYFTMWYGVYDSRRRSLIYSSAGHHPAFLVPADKRHATPLRTAGTVIGACADATFAAAEVGVPEGSSLYLFSDGVCEILTKDRHWHLSDFVPLLLQPASPGTSECRRLSDAVTAARCSSRRDDDFSMLIVTFP